MNTHPFIARFLLIVSMLVLLSNIGIAQSASAKPITQKGLTDALKIGGLDEHELINAIKTRGVDFILTPQIEQSLRAVGASDGVINATRGNYHGATAAPIPPPQPPLVQANVPAVASTNKAKPLNPGVYLLNGSAWSPLPVESITWEGAGLMRGIRKATGGLLNEQITGTIAGSHSDTSIHAPVSFLLRLAPGTTAVNYLLLHLHGKRDNREFKAGLGGEKSSDEVVYQATRTTDGSFFISFTQGSGDYAFVLRSDIPKDKGAENPGKAYSFRILE